MIRIIVEKKSYNKENINEKKDKRGATPAYCKRTPCKKMGFTQKASCKSQGIKDCYRGKKNESNFYSPGFKSPKDFPKIKAKIAYIGYAGTVNGGFLEEKKRDPKVGTGRSQKVQADASTLMKILKTQCQLNSELLPILEEHLLKKVLKQNLTKDSLRLLI